MDTIEHFATGNSCRLGSALFAGPAALVQFLPTLSRPILRLPETAQLPPATLFAALARGRRRCLAERRTASGTRLANASFTRSAACVRSE
jgi:hypothetical protein